MAQKMATTLPKFMLKLVVGPFIEDSCLVKDPSPLLDATLLIAGVL